MSKMNKRIVEK